MMQIPNLPNYVQVPQQPNYNAVKIDIVNPMVNVPPAQQYPGQVQYPAQAQNSPYAVPTVPIYNYPQVQTQPYCAPQTVAPQPQMVAPQQPQMPQITPPQVPPMAVYPNAPAVEIPLQPQAVPPAPVVMTQPKSDNNQQPVAEKPVEIVPPQEIKPQVDLNEFLARLANPNFEIQAAAMEEIANMVEKEPKKAENLLDTQVIKALNSIIQKDTSALEGPTAEQEALRQKLFNNETITDAEKTLALTMTPKEQAERNKSYAIFTTAIMQKLYADEYKKMNNATVPITELPGAVTIVEQLKNNPNAMVRTSAIEALSYIQDPNYKKDLTTIFTIAQNDIDKGVQEAAKVALDKLNKIPDGEDTYKQAA